jgi:hypothetical protein
MAMSLALFVVPLAVAPSATAAPPVFAPHPAYAALFEAGKTWHFRVAHTASRYDGDKRATVRERSSSEASCRVSEVVHVPWGVASTIQCDGLEPNGAPDPVSGRWVATAKGLFRLHDERDARSAPPTADERVLSASPAPLDVTRADAAEPGFGERETVKREGHAWCATKTSWGGDSSWSSVCLEAGVGVRSGSWGWEGGSTHESELSLVP